MPEEILADAAVDAAPDLETPFVGAVRASVLAAATRLGFRVPEAFAARVLAEDGNVCAASVIAGRMQRS